MGTQKNNGEAQRYSWEHRRIMLKPRDIAREGRGSQWRDDQGWRGAIPPPPAPGAAVSSLGHGDSMHFALPHCHPAHCCVLARVHRHACIEHRKTAVHTTSTAAMRCTLHSKPSVSPVDLSVWPCHRQPRHRPYDI